GVESVKPGDALFAVADVRFTHEYVTPMAASLLTQALGVDARVTEPDSVFAFRDHLTFLNKVMSPKHREMGLLEKAEGLATTQESFTAKKGSKRPDVAAKDVMLFILATDYMKTSKGIGKVLEFAGDDLKNWLMDERATLTNMSVEAGGFTGIIEPDEQTLEYIVKMRGLDA